jgi:hypothetical protein
MLMEDLSVNGFGIGAQDLDEAGPAAQFFEGPRGRWLRWPSMSM